jgi:predicted O-methyltransferase YrrM
LPEGPDALGREVARLADGAWGLAALSAVAEAKLLRALAEPGSAEAIAHRTGAPPNVVARLLDVLVALGFALAALLRDREALDALLGEARTALLQASDLAARARAGLAEGWHHEDPEILRSQGATSAAAVPVIAERLVPSLDGLAERLGAPTAAALDVGTGVAAVAIGLCRRFPALHVVGLEPASAPLAEARRNITAAGLESRIELRAQRVEDLADEAAFDLAFLPIVFLATDTLRSGLTAVLRALRPGGWVLMASMAVPGDDLAPALARLRATLWGSEALPPEAVGALAEEVGYAEVRFFGGGPGATLTPIVARRG